MPQPTKKRCTNANCMGADFDVTTAVTDCVMCGKPLRSKGIDSLIEGLVGGHTYADRQTEPGKSNPMKDFFGGLSG